MKDYKEKKPAKRFIKSTKPLSSGDQKMKDYHESSQQEPKPCIIGDGEIIDPDYNLVSCYSSVMPLNYAVSHLPVAPNGRTITE